MKCRICQSNDLSSFVAKEMVLGLEEEFLYLQCKECKTLQIAQIPNNLAKYYPTDYYSLKEPLHTTKFNKFKSTLIKSRDMDVLGVRKSITGKLVNKIKPAQFDSMYLAYAFVYQQKLKNKNISIHDIGCGNGFFLKYFHDLGYKGLSGSDSFLNQDIDYGDYKVYNSELKDIKGQFDVLILNHVIEHVVDVREFLTEVRNKLSKGGKCLIRTPMSTSLGFEMYKEHWVGLEPPRHLHVFDQNYFIHLCKEFDLICEAVEYDTIGWHYQVSDAYQKNISLKALEQESNLNQHELSHFNKLAANANDAKRGDTICYYLKKQ